jgi:hypothetical protein
MGGDAAGKYLVAHRSQADHLITLIDGDLDQRTADGARQADLMLAFLQAQAGHLGIVRQGAPRTGIGTFQHGREIPTARPASGLVSLIFFCATPLVIARTVVRT